MSNDETYNGWANRETWAFNLHWQNDQSMYWETLDNFRTAAGQTESDTQLGELVVDYWREQIDEWPGGPLPEAYRMFDREVGSWWRVDRKEVGAAVREALANEQ